MIVLLVLAVLPTILIAQVDSTGLGVSPVDSVAVVTDAGSSLDLQSMDTDGSRTAVMLKVGITTEEFSDFRRIVIPGVVDTIRPPLVSTNIDSGMRQFTVVITPIDTSGLLEKYHGYFRGNRPVKYSAMFPDSITLNLVIQSTRFSEIQTVYDYSNTRITVDIFDEKTPVPVETPTLAKATEIISKNEAPLSKSTGKSSLFSGPNARPLLIVALFMAAILIILGAGVILFLMRVIRRRKKASEPVEPLQTFEKPTPDRFEKTSRYEDSPSETTGQNPIKKSDAAKSEVITSDTEIHNLMKQQGITYDEAKVLAWMNRRKKS